LKAVYIDYFAYLVILSLNCTRMLRPSNIIITVTKQWPG